MSPGPNAPLFPQISSLISAGGSGYSGSETTLSVNWKEKKNDSLGSAWKNSSIIQKEQGTVFGGYFFPRRYTKDV